MLFNIGGYFIGASFIIFAGWNLIIMFQAIGMNREERKSFMSDKVIIESKNRVLKPARLTGYTFFVLGFLIYLLGYFF